MDLLSEVLSYVQIESTSFGCLKLSAPWGFVIPLNSTAHFLCVTHGQCWLERGDGSPLSLSAGDFVMFTRGGQSIFKSSPDAQVRPLVDMIRAHYLADYSIERRDLPPFCISEGGGGAPTVLVGGAIDLPAGMGDMLIAALPEFIHLSSTDSATRRWLAPLVEMIVEEVDEASVGVQGHAAVSKRLGEMLFLRIIQAHWLRKPEETSGWLRGLCDAKIRKVLQATHPISDSLAHASGGNEALGRGTPYRTAGGRARISVRDRFLAGIQARVRGIAGRLPPPAVFEAAVGRNAQWADARHVRYAL
jgi:hypothetical protein